MDELIAFVRRCLDDDERVALAAHANIWTAEESARHDGEVLIVPDHTPSGVGVVFGAKNAEHIARWDPARVLAEVEAKRRILRTHSRRHDCAYIEGTDLHGPCSTVVFMAQPYAGHDGWREEWRV